MFYKDLASLLTNKYRYVIPLQVSEIQECNIKKISGYGMDKYGELVKMHQTENRFSSC